MVQVGDTAPDFTLTGTQGDEVREFSLSAFAAGRPAMLVFYVYDFSPVCADQMCELNDMEMLTFNDEIAVLGISPDGPYSHQQFIDRNNLSYPLLTDEEKQVYDQYEMLEETTAGKRNQKRGIVLLDADRTVRYRWVADDNWASWDMEPLNEAYEISQELGSPNK
ncbi:redoxin domain-containing protein [Halorubrum salipaludis]|nr:redoxin domain-containing protein [Halorubrum salipaludis]